MSKSQFAPASPGGDGCANGVCGSGGAVRRPGLYRGRHVWQRGARRGGGGCTADGACGHGGPTGGGGCVPGIGCFEWGQ